MSFVEAKYFISQNKNLDKRGCRNTCLRQTMSNRYSAFMICHTNAICHFRVTDHVKGAPGTQFVTPSLHHFNLSSFFPLVYVVYHLQLTHSVTGVANLHRKPLFLMQKNKHCSNLMHLLYAKQSLDLYHRMHFDQRCLSLSLTQSLYL